MTKLFISTDNKKEIAIESAKNYTNDDINVVDNIKDAEIVYFDKGWKNSERCVRYSNFALNHGITIIEDYRSN